MGEAAVASHTRAQELVSGWMGTSHVVPVKKYPKNVRVPGGEGRHRPSLVFDARAEKRKGGPSLRVLPCYPEKLVVRT